MHIEKVVVLKGREETAKISYQAAHPFPRGLGAQWDLVYSIGSQQTRNFFIKGVKAFMNLGIESHVSTLMSAREVCLLVPSAKGKKTVGRRSRPRQ